jgi:two-component system sensor histidine kinase CiaH
MWYLAIVMTISLVFSGVLYHITTNELDRGIRHESQRIFNQYPVFEDDPRFQPAPEVSNSTHRVLWRLVGFNIVVFVAAGGASYWLARRTLEPIEAAHEQQKRFTADVSHELRTPLTALKMESEVALMNDKASAKELRETLTSNLEEVSKMENLINNILRLTKLEAEELQQTFKPVLVKDIFAAAIKQVEPQAKERGIKVVQTSSNDKLNGDHDSLTQLLVILLDNAIKYSPNDTKVALVSTKQNDTLRLSVEDQGVGIKRKDLEHVFDRFYRTDSSRTNSAKQGHGLGLSIAKMIADLHKGSITLTSQPKKGTTVTVDLPITK